MSKIKFKVKLTGLEIEFEGTREDVPIFTNAISNQLTGLISPPSEMVDDNAEVLQSTPASIPASPSKKRQRKSPRTQSSASKSESNKNREFTWRHDATKYSAPTQEWKTLQKALWTLYVVEAELNTTEMTATEIENAFNKNFRTLGTIRGTNISRDFGQNKKSGKDSWVGEDTSNSPSMWYLTAKGKEHVKTLIEKPISTKDKNGSN